MSRILPYIFRLVVGCVFVVSAVLKFVSIDSFELYLFSFDLVNLDLSFLLARLIVASEFALGVALASNQYRRLVDFISYSFLFVFSLFLLSRLIVGDDSNCHCMGEFMDIPPLPSLAKNIVLAIFIFLSRKAKSFLIPYSRFWVPGVGLIFLVLLFVVSPPDTMAKDHKKLVHASFASVLAQQTPFGKPLSLSGDKHLVCLFSPSCHVCQLSAHKLQLLLDKYEIDDSRVTQFFACDSAALQQFYDKSESRPHNPQILHPEVFWQLVPSVPVFVVMTGGQIDTTFSYRTMNEDLISSLK